MSAHTMHQLHTGSKNWQAVDAGKLTQKLRIPRHGDFQPLHDGMHRLVAQQLPGLADVGLRVAHVAGAEIAIAGFFRVADPVLRERVHALL